MVFAAKNYMMERIDYPIRMEDLSDQLGVGYSWFRHAFRSFTGMAPKQYHIQLRVEKVKRLLAGSMMSVKEIGLQLHFESPYYFMKLFKKKIGMSPTQWRRRSGPSHNIDW